MAYQKVTTTSYGGRLKNALSGVAAGFVMLIAGTVLLFWNEGRTVNTTKMLKESQGVCVELDNIQQIDSEKNGKMIHASGDATTEDVLTDGQFGLSLNAIRLIRTVEFYQWVQHEHSETKDKVGGGQETVTTYTYSKEWVNEPKNSSGFEDPSYRGIDNDVLLMIEDNTWQAENVSFGAYTLPKALISQMNNAVPCNVELPEETVRQYEADFHRVYNVAETTSFMHPSGNVLYIGANPNNPTVGDVRITYKKVLPGVVSILAKVNGNTFEPYTYTKKDNYSLMVLKDGSLSMEEMFSGEHAANKTTAWILRLIGVLLVFFGFKNIFNIITQLLKVLPFLANVADLGINLVAGVLAFAWCFVVIAIAWLWARPLLGILLLAAAAALIWFLGKKSKEKKAAMAAAGAPVQPQAPVQPAAPVKPAAPAQPQAPQQPLYQAPQPSAPDFSDAPAPDYSDAPAPGPDDIPLQ